MKKNLSLLLAGVITLTSIPVNVFANTQVNVATNITGNPVVAAQHTALRQQGLQGSGDVNTGNNARYYTEGRNMVFRFPDSTNPDIKLTSPMQVELILENAVWNIGEDIGTQQLKTPSNWNPETSTLTIDNNLGITLQATPNTSSAVLTIEGTAPNMDGNIQQALNHAKQALEEVTEVKNSSTGTGENTIAGEIITAQESGLKATRAAFEAAIYGEELRSAIGPGCQGDRFNHITPEEHRRVSEAKDAINVAVDLANKIIIANNGTPVTRLIPLNPNPQAPPLLQDELYASQLSMQNKLREINDTTTGIGIESDPSPHAIAAQNRAANAALNALVATPPVPVDNAVITASHRLEFAIIQMFMIFHNNYVNTGHPAYPYLESAFNALRGHGNTHGSFHHMQDITRVLRASNVNVDAILGANGYLERLHTSLIPVTNDLNTAIRLLEEGAIIPAGTIIEVPLIIRTTSNSSATVRVGKVTAPQGVTVQQDRLTFTIPVEAGATTTLVPNPQTASAILPVENITIQENMVTTLPQQGAFELVAPTGYKFTNVSDATVVARGGISAPNSAFEITTVETNNSVIRVSWENLTQSNQNTGEVIINGLSLVPINNVITEGDVYIEIRNVEGKPEAVTNQKFLAGTMEDWDVSLTPVGQVPNLVNGRLVGPGVQDFDLTQGFEDTYHQAVTVRVEETAANTLFAQRSTTFTLPEEVNILEVQFSEINNINANEFEGSHVNGAQTSNVRVNQNVITLVGLDTGDDRSSFEMDLWLSIKPGFEGDIKLEMGNSITSNTETLVIAEVINPATITTEVTNVRVGPQFIEVGNITITENVPGALIQGKEVFVSVVDEASTRAIIANNFSLEVTSGNIEIRDAGTTSTGQDIRFLVDKESTVASTIELSNIEIRTTLATTPASNYDVLVWGPGIANNYQGLHDTGAQHRDFERVLFETQGILTEYIVASEMRPIVSVTVGSNQATVGDEIVILDAVPYISPQSDSVMVPVRFVSEALGYDVHWNPATSEITITTPQIARREARTIVFQMGTSYMTINGVVFNMVNANGDPIYSELTNNRAFIPFRPLGYALNVYVMWDEETKTASFDPNREYDPQAFIPVKPL